MKDIVVEERPKCIEDLWEYHKSFFFLKKLLLLYQIFKRAAIAEFIDKIYVVLGTQNLHKRNDIRVT